MNLKKCVQNGLKKCDCTIYMEMNIATLPKKGLNARPYSMDMNKEDHTVTLPKKGLKTRPYNIGMEKLTQRNMAIIYIWIWIRKILRNLLRNS